MVRGKTCYLQGEPKTACFYHRAFFQFCLAHPLYVYRLRAYGRHRQVHILTSVPGMPSLPDFPGLPGSPVTPYNNREVKPLTYASLVLNSREIPDDPMHAGGPVDCSLPWQVK